MNSKYSVEWQKKMSESTMIREKKFEDGKNERFPRRGTRTTYQKQVALKKNVSKNKREWMKSLCKLNINSVGIHFHSLVGCVYVELTKTIK